MEQQEAFNDVAIAELAKGSQLRCGQRLNRVVIIL